MEWKLEDCFAITGEVFGCASMHVDQFRIHLANNGGIPTNICVMPEVLLLGNDNEILFNKSELETKFGKPVTTTQLPEDIEFLTDTDCVLFRANDAHFTIFHGVQLGFVCDENYKPLAPLMGTFLWFPDNQIFLGFHYDGKTKIGSFVNAVPAATLNPIWYLKNRFLSISDDKHDYLEEYDVGRILDMVFEQEIYFPLFMHTYQLRQLQKWRSFLLAITNMHTAAFGPIS